MCGYSGELCLAGSGHEYSIRRYRVGRCYFELVDDYIESRPAEYQIDDLRGGCNV